MSVLPSDPVEFENPPLDSHLLQVQDTPVTVTDDQWSDRLRCDHPPECDGLPLGEALIELAEQTGRGRIVTLVTPSVAAGMEAAGFASDGVLPGFYGGLEDCVVMGMATDPDRGELAHAREVAAVDALLAGQSAHAAIRQFDVSSQRAGVDDAEAIANLIGQSFAAYPTPSTDPAYVAAQIEQGTPFRVVRDGDEQVVACASADLILSAQTAELTDCATHPEFRGRGLMQLILGDLMQDVQQMDYPTVFTMARARIAGINLAFQRLGFVYCGRMVQSCRIGEGIEDMNLWSLAFAQEQRV